MEELRAKPIKILLDNGLSFLKEEVVEPIWTRGIVKRELKDDAINLLMIEREAQMIQIIVGLNERVKIKLHGGINFITKPSPKFLEKGHSSPHDQKPSD